MQISDTTEIDGEQRHTLNSCGRPIALTHDGLVAFWRYFADSSATDHLGRPLVVYHGTSTDFYEFSDGADKKGSMGNSLGYYFTDSPDAASSYGDEGHVMPVYACIRNPLRFDSRMIDRDDIGEKIALDLSKIRGAPDRAEPYWYFKNGGAYDGRADARVGDAVMAAAKREGFDGAIYKERIGGKLVDVYMAFSAPQIKSAIGNPGIYDANSPHLTDGHEIRLGETVDLTYATERPESSSANPSTKRFRP